VNGGPKRIALHEPWLTGNAERYLLECLASNYVSSVGPFVTRFEEEFAAFVGARYAVATCNGTAAIHTALLVLGVGPGDDVLVSTFTFVASVNPIRYQGASPVLIDSEPRTWNMDPALVAAEVEARAAAGRPPKAILVVHLYGHPADMDPILETANRFGIPVIEDAAESLGATHRGRAVGTLGSVGCYSFNGNKVITTGGGGMLVTNDPELARRARHLTTQAKRPGLEYWHDNIGYNYRLTNLQAALGVAQLEVLPSFLERKRQIAATYAEAFANVPGIRLLRQAEWAQSSWWLNCILVDRDQCGTGRVELIEELGREGIQARPSWVPIHRLPIYADAERRGGAVAEHLFLQGLSLPSSPSLTSDAQQRVIECVLARVQKSRSHGTHPVGSG
jgi:aminotransferase in exopolysaccharide biosynthesis